VKAGSVGSVLIWPGRLAALPVFAAAIAGEDCRVVSRVQRMKTARAQRAASPRQAWVGQDPICPPRVLPGVGRVRWARRLDAAGPAGPPYLETTLTDGHIKTCPTQEAQGGSPAKLGHHRLVAAAEE
jgi:hypothetical protein